MDFKNWKLKRKQLKAMEFNNDFGYYLDLPYNCPKCHWATDTLKAYVIHLENHLGKPKNKRKIKLKSKKMKKGDKNE